MTTRKPTPNDMVSKPQYTPEPGVTLTPTDGGIVTDKPTPVDAPVHNDTVNAEPTKNATPGEMTEAEGGMIVFNERVVNSEGVAETKVHGPMPVSEWAAYEKENNL